MLGANSKFEAIFWIKGQYQVEIGDYFVIFAKQAVLTIELPWQQLSPK